MAEEAVAEPGALARALDQPRQIGEHELLAMRLDHAELRAQRGEGVIGDLGPGARDGGEEGRLAGIGQPHQPGIGDQLQAQPDPALLAGPAGVGAARRAVGRALVMRIAEAAIAASKQDMALAGGGEVEQHLLILLVEDLGADRHAQHHILAGGAGAVGAHAVMAFLGLEMLQIAVVDERVEIGRRLDHDIAAAAAIAAVGTAELDEFLAPEARPRRRRRRRFGGRSWPGRGISWRRSQAEDGKRGNAAIPPRAVAAIAARRAERAYSAASAGSGATET